MEAIDVEKSNINLYMQSNDNFEINISVGNFLEQKSTLTTHTTYPLKGKDREGQFECNKRYSDFAAVRSLMVSRWPGCFVPSLPEKKFIGNHQAGFLENRRRGLQHFCVQMSKLKYLWYSTQFQTFLRKAGDVEKNLKVLGQEDVRETVKKYEQRLDNLKNKSTDTMIQGKILNFAAYLKKITPVLEKLKSTIQSYIHLRSTNNQQYGILFNYLLPQYEKNCLSEYVNQATEGKFILADATNDHITQSINKLKQLIAKKDFDELLFNIDLELKQIDAFLEVFKVQAEQEYKLKEWKLKQKQFSIEQQKLAIGKQSFFKSVFKTNIQDQKKEVEVNMNIAKQKIQLYSLLCSLTNIALGYFQIDRFKKNKTAKYYDVIKKIAKLQQDVTTLRQQIFENLLQNQNLLQKQ